MCADFNMSNKEKTNLATSTNSNDTANESHVDGVKQAAALSLYLYTFLIMKWVMITKMKPNSESQDQNMQFPMIYISHYTVSNKRLVWMEHMNLIKDMVARGLQHFQYKAHDTSGSISERYSVIIQNTHNKQIDVTFFGIFGTFTGHSISLGVDNDTLNSGLYAQLMIKKYLASINILYMSFKKGSVINFNHRDKSQTKKCNK